MSISVVIPAYNASLFIAETLRSVLAQTYPVNDIIVVDDGSTDNTADIAESFGAPVRVFRQPNARQAAARNFGVSQATSEWIAFLDADDLWLPHKIERQLAELARNPHADLCYTGCTWLVQQGSTATLGPAFPAPPASHIRQALLKEVTFLPSSVLMRRSAFLAVGGFNPRYRFGTEDYDLWLRLRHHGTHFAACTEPLTLYRRHDNNTSINLSWFEECMEIHRLLIHPHLPPAIRRRESNIFYSTHEVGAAYALREKGDPKALAMMLAAIRHRPLYEPHRYLVLAHMLYQRFFRPDPPRQSQVR